MGCDRGSKIGSDMGLHIGSNISREKDINKPGT
jgi:hypothetical protein